LSSDLRLAGDAGVLASDSIRQQISERGETVINISEVQIQLEQTGLDGWLLYDFQGLNPIARKMVGVQGNLLTRRWYCWIPRRGDSVVLCHQIEQQGFRSLDTQVRVFKSWTEMMDGLKDLLKGHGTIAMEYSPLCAIPYISRVDAGTVEAIAGLGKKIVSSANLVQYFQARWSAAQLQMHFEASHRLMAILFKTLSEIGDAVRRKASSTEYSVQQAILERFRQHELTTASPPIVGVNQNSANPHYEPAQDYAVEIRAGDLLLVDLWAKLNKPDAVYADYTWMAYLGQSVPERIQTVWETVKGARDATIAFVRENHAAQKPIQGWEVDIVTRKYITERGFGDFFIHRTGHNIGEDDHGTGANLDSLETKDERQLMTNTCFSIEPGIYLPEFGVRSEVNVYLDPQRTVVTGDPIQTEIYSINTG
jgi:Xaa-Pro dipeptidase